MIKFRIVVALKDIQTGKGPRELYGVMEIYTFVCMVIK